MLSSKQKEEAVESFYSSKAKEIQRRDENISTKEALIQAKKSKTIPERYYREKMTENQGLLIIYLFDSEYVFNQKGKNSDNLEKNSEGLILKEEFKNYIDTNEINTKIPLVGFAIGFPPMENGPGGEYMQGDYELNEDEGEDEDEAENEEMPTDINEI